MHIIFKKKIFIYKLMTSKEHVFTVSELTEYLKSVVSNKKVKVSGEVSQPKLSNGHLYFTLKDDTNNLKSIIWKFKNINKDEIVEGQKITLECKLDFYGGSGSLNLIVEKIITNEGQGELFIKYEKIKKQFESKGYFDQARKKRVVPCIKDILIITSASGAALQDFIYNLENNKSKVNYDIVDVVVQGVDCPENICEILSKAKADKLSYDLVVIMRGGGSFADLFGFSQPELIHTVYDFHLPVLSAIGHQVDNPLLDLVADVCTPTPSLAAQFIVDHNKKFLNNLEVIRDKIQSELLDEITEHQTLYTKLNEKLYKTFNTLGNLKSQLLNELRQDIGNLMIKYTQLESQVIIKNQNQIKLFNRKKEITNSDELDKLIGQTVKIIWGEKEFKIKIIE
jgi:exodeoxyribonuclease VII large subunit